MFTYTLADKARGTDNGIGGTLALGKRVTHGLELELVGFFSDYHTKQEDFSTPQSKSMRLYGGGLGANLYLAPSMVPGLFLHLDVMRGQANGQPGPSSAAHYGTTMFDAGLGYDVPLRFTLGGLIDYPSLRFEALYRQDSNNKGTIGTNTNGDQHYFTEAAFNVGLRIPFGRVAAPAVEPAPPPPVQVVPEAPAPAAPPPPAPPPCQPPAPGQPISLEGCKAGDVIILHGVNFEFNKATLTLNAKALLDQVGDALLARKDIKVEIDGHTDGKGTVPYNLRLSQERADSVKAYLVGRGVDEGRMSTKGFGKSMPIATNDTDEGREANRRVELKVTESNGGGVESAPPEGAAAPADSSGSAAPVDSGAAAAAPAPADSGSSAPAPADSGSSTPPASDAPASQSGPPGETPASGAAPQ
jgi:outer membrane protein OmpA-like peptidoglycan-associated protein